MSEKPISPLRQRMTDDMTARQFKEKVQKRSRFRSSRPNHAIKSCTTGDDNGVSVNSQSAKGRSGENPSAVGCVAAASTSIHLIARPLRCR